MNEHELSEAWRAASLRYVTAINDYILRGRQHGWDSAGPQPKDDRQLLAAPLLEILRNANRSGDTHSLRTAFPPAWEPFLPMLEANGQTLGPMQWIDNSRLALHIGSVYERGRVVLVSEHEVVEYDGVANFGRSPCGAFCVWATDERLEVRRGWGGPLTAQIPWHEPSASQGLEAEQLIAFPDGRRVLLASRSGIFVLSADHAVCLEPSAQQRAARLEEGSRDELSMPHGAISPNGQWIVAGHQDSRHLVFDSALTPIAAVGPHSEYPHFAWFSADGQLVAFNACHFYSGTSISVRVEDLRGMSTDAYAQDVRVRVLEKQSRVYAAVARDEELIIGDAYGYLRAFDLDGTFRWEHFIGSSLNSLDLSPDGRRLAVTSSAGFCCVLELDSPERDPFAIGVGAQRELWRWIFWKQEERPLRW